jgi:hypothetical protein
MSLGDRDAVEGGALDHLRLADEGEVADQITRVRRSDRAIRVLVVAEWEDETAPARVDDEELGEGGVEDGDIGLAVSVIVSHQGNVQVGGVAERLRDRPAAGFEG